MDIELNLGPIKLKEIPSQPQWNFYNFSVHFKTYTAEKVHTFHAHKHSLDPVLFKVGGSKIKSPP